MILNAFIDWNELYCCLPLHAHIIKSTYSTILLSINKYIETGWMLWPKREASAGYVSQTIGIPCTCEWWTSWYLIARWRVTECSVQKSTAGIESHRKHCHRGCAASLPDIDGGGSSNRLLRYSFNRRWR